VKSLKLSKSANDVISYEINQIEKLIEQSDSLFQLIQLKEPDFVERSAIALILHSFYNGIENILEIIFKDLNESSIQHSAWHRSLLDSSFSVTDKRSPIFRKSLQNELNEYLAFRHFIRHSYGFEIIWEKMKPLFVNLRKYWKEMKLDIETFTGECKTSDNKS
jgi:hypothetical protein